MGNAACGGCSDRFTMDNDLKQDRIKVTFPIFTFSGNGKQVSTYETLG